MADVALSSPTEEGRGWSRYRVEGMGSLDDAIREHLELKRLRGVAPTEVAHEEQEVFGSGHRGLDDALDEGHDVHEGSVARADVTRTPSEVASSGELDLSHVGQETAEIDMRSVLEPEPAAGESLEWEVPGESGRDASEEPSGTEASPAQAGSEPAEDVLQETPDFLRETPEQDRLWFEQQPPRDFDFDK
jgi:hypothetical protein